MSISRVKRVMPRLEGATRQYKLTVITPVHIGGQRQRLGLHRFACEGTTCYVLDELRFLRWLTARDQSLVDHYVETVIERENGHLQRFLNQAFVRRCYQPRPLGDILEEIAAYRVSMPSGIRPSSIRPFIRDASWRPYLPGTAIKGALRSALLHHLLSKHRERHLSHTSTPGENVYVKLVAALQRIRDREKLDDQLVEELLQGYSLTAERVEGSLSDLFRAIHVKDPQPLERDAIQVSPVRIISEESGGWHRSGGRQPIFVETVPPVHVSHISYTITIRIDMDLLRQFSKARADLPLPTDTEDHAVERLFDLCWAFAKEQKHEELVFWERLYRKMPDGDQRVKRLRDFYRTEVAWANVRIGWGSGLVGTTLLSILDAPARKALRQNDPFFKKEFLRQKYQGLDDPAGQWVAFPKSRRVVVDHDDVPSLPLGWCKLERIG